MTAGCRAWPEQEEGPYHLDLDGFRQDIVEDRVGVPLDLRVLLVAADATTPVGGAVVEIWQCDALGRYSGFPPPDRAKDATSLGLRRRGDPFRGAVSPGKATNRRCGSLPVPHDLPGWYPAARSTSTCGRSRRKSFTSQLYFPDDVTDAVFTQPPYRERPGRDTTNATDSIFRTGGEGIVVALEGDGSGYRTASV